MKIFETTNKIYRLLAYDAIDQGLIDRHYHWCQNRSESEQAIYMIFFIQSKEEYQQWKSNKLNNKYCLVYYLEKKRDINWMINFCKECYADESR